MQLDDLDHIRDIYQHVYLSPHLDDAALSCGGAITLQRAKEERVLVVTLCTATPAPETEFSDLALEFHRIWQLSPAEAVAARLREERLAMERLGVDYYWAGMLDAIYRYPQAYQSRESLFGTPAPEDPLLPALREFLHVLRERVPSAMIYAPLGVGSHVDHLITYRVALDEAGEQRAFYEDFPYVTQPHALDQRLAALDGKLSARTITIDSALAAKIEVITGYASQLDELFGGPAAMVQSVTSYAHGVCPDAGASCERIWV